jgi:dolichol kinase
MDYQNELQRKLFHIAAASLGPLLYLVMPRGLALWIAVPVMIVIVALDVLRQAHPRLKAIYDRRFGHLMRADEQQRLSGASYVAIAIVLCVFLFPKKVAIAALLFMSVSDALASLIGMRFGGRRWTGKTWAGSAAFLVSALGLALLMLPDHPLAAIGGAVAAAIIEGAPLRIGRARIDDNLSVPLAGGAAMWALLRL